MIGELHIGDRISYLDDYGRTVTGRIVARRLPHAPPFSVHVELDRPRKPVVWFEQHDMAAATVREAIDDVREHLDRMAEARKP